MSLESLLLTGQFRVHHGESRSQEGKIDTPISDEALHIHHFDDTYSGGFQCRKVDS